MSNNENSIEKSVQDKLKENYISSNGDIDLSAENIVYTQNKKPGLDVQSGQYRIVGAVTHSRVFRRKGAGTNIAPAIGYKVEELATGKILMVTKQQAVVLCALYGMTNAYIAQRVQKTPKDSNGEVLQEPKSTYLMPYPPRNEAFTQDSRLTTIFKLDTDCTPIRPLELDIVEEDCTEELWRVVQLELEKGSKMKKRERRGTTDNKKTYIDDVLSALKSEGYVRNPFK